MDIVDFFIYLIRYTPLFVLVVFSLMLLYLQIREARSKS
jgi:hypothetical protein